VNSETFEKMKDEFTVVGRMNKGKKRLVSSRLTQLSSELKKL